MAAARRPLPPLPPRTRLRRLQASAARHPAATLWWLRPAPLMLVLVLPVYLSYLMFPFENVVPKRYVPSIEYLWGIALILLIATGAWLASQGAGSAVHRSAPDARRATPLRVDIPATYLAVLLAATLLAYAVWFGPLLGNPGKVIELLTGVRGNLRDEIETQPGITTLTQCGVAFIVLYVIKRHAGMTPPAPWERAAVVLIFALTAVRTVLWSERLALIEATVAYVVTQAAFLRLRSLDAWRFAATLPFVGTLLLYVAFTVTEYFRSWVFYRNVYDSVWTFSFERLTSYYAVATNSGIGLLRENSRWPEYTGHYVLEWAYRLPFVGEVLSDLVDNDAREQYRRFLEDHARIEFNNPTGFFITTFDIGYVGAALYFFAAGLLVGVAWKSWFRHRIGGLMFYPFCFLFLLELLRFNYFAASRFIPIAGSLLVAFLIIALPTVRRRAHPDDIRTRGGIGHHGSAIERTL